MDPASLAIGAIALVEPCIRVGQILIDKFKAYQNAEAEIMEMFLEARGCWIKVDRQMKFLADLWNSIEGDLQVHFNLLFQNLEIKLQKTTKLLDLITKESGSESRRLESKGKGEIKRGSYALSVKKCLVQTITDLEKWQQRFDPSWYLMLRSSSPQIDEHLKTKSEPSINPLNTLRAIRISMKDRKSGLVTDQIFTHDFLEDRKPIKFSSALFGRSASNKQEYIVSSMTPRPFVDATSSGRDAAALAWTLTKSDPAIFGLLRCSALIKKIPPLASGKQTEFEFVFQMPSNFGQPRSLRHVLLDGVSLPSLNEKIALSIKLANAVLFLHSTKFVHKNIRPETILLFPDESTVFAGLYLVGFEFFRTVDGATFRKGDSLWHREIYRHPERQTSCPEETYSMQHDVYSLGVCLLEIGLWNSLVVMTSSRGPRTPNRKLGFNSDLTTDSIPKAFEIRRKMIEIAEKSLPSRMGRRFTDVVLTCLKGLDSSTSQPDGVANADIDEGIDIGVQFVHNVLVQLQKIDV